MDKILVTLLTILLPRLTPVIAEIIDRFLDELARTAKTTPNAVDDLVVEALQQILHPPTAEPEKPE